MQLSMLALQIVFTFVLTVQPQCTIGTLRLHSENKSQYHQYQEFHLKRDDVFRCDVANAKSSIFKRRLT